MTNSFLENMKKNGLLNPHYEKWKRGRPTKRAIEKRKLADIWNAENVSNVGFLSSLLTHPKKSESLKSNNKRKILYIQRKTG